jgi:hypothetical protein
MFVSALNEGQCYYGVQIHERCICYLHGLSFSFINFDGTSDLIVNVIINCAYSGMQVK